MKTASVLFLVLIAQSPSKYKNIQVLNGLTDAEIQQTMTQWSRQLGVNCTGCHVQGDFATDEPRRKGVARAMHRMVQAINSQPLFRDNPRKVDCYICHRGVIPP